MLNDGQLRNKIENGTWVRELRQENVNGKTNVQQSLAMRQQLKPNGQPKKQNGQNGNKPNQPQRNPYVPQQTPEQIAAQQQKTDALIRGSVLTDRQSAAQAE